MPRAAVAVFIQLMPPANTRLRGSAVPRWGSGKRRLKQHVPRTGFQAGRPDDCVDAGHRPGARGLYCWMPVISLNNWPIPSGASFLVYSPRAPYCRLFACSLKIQPQFQAMLPFPCVPTFSASCHDAPRLLLEGNRRGTPKKKGPPQSVIARHVGIQSTFRGRHGTASVHHQALHGFISPKRSAELRPCSPFTGIT